MAFIYETLNALSGKEIRTEQKTIKIHTDTYLITAVPFYNYGNENEFKITLEDTLKI